MGEGRKESINCRVQERGKMADLAEARLHDSDLPNGRRERTVEPDQFKTGVKIKWQMRAGPWYIKWRRERRVWTRVDSKVGRGAGGIC
jgi:hypothetical protein